MQDESNQSQGNRNISIISIVRLCKGKADVNVQALVKQCKPFERLS